jgi:ketosteroid isomerase-like protein
VADIEKEIEDVLRRHDEAWSRLDVDAIAELWDRAFSPVYIGDEYREPVLGWNELSRHFGRIGARLSSAHWSSRLVALRQPAPDLVLATLLVSWTLLGVESDMERRGNSWWTMLMRRTDVGWRFLHQAETPTYLPIDPDELPTVRRGAGRE